MKETHMMSFLVYNYMKERQITNIATSNKYQKRLNIKMEYEQYSPGESSFIHRLSEKPQARQFIKKNTPLKNNYQQKRPYEDKMEKSAPLTLPSSELFHKKKNTSNSQVNVSKIQQVKEKTKTLKKSLMCQADNYHFNTFYWNTSENGKNFKYKINGKFGLDIKSIKTSSKSQQRKSNLLANKSTIQQRSIDDEKKQVLSEDQKVEETLEYKNQLLKKVKNSNLKDKKFAIKKSVLKINQESRSLEARIQRMFNFFAINLYSYGCYMKTTQLAQILKITLGKKKGQKYFYYVGNGNNKNLIISIMKKRWWWIQTDEITSANLVWTQLKVPSVLQNQTSMKYSQMDQADPNIFIAADKYIQKNQNRAIQKIFHKKMDSKFHQRLRKQEQVKFFRELKAPNVTHNHYQCNYMLGNKKALFHGLSNYYMYLKKSLNDIIPTTFHIQRLNSKNWKQFQKEGRKDKNALWIIKPGQNSNRGNGIFVEKEVLKIKKRIQKNKQTDRTYIIQKYVKNLMLFQKRKFDIRTYLLMVSIGGVTKYFWYNEGYLRTSSQIYDTQQIQDLYIHLTNDAIQSKSDNYGKYEQGNKISYHEFQRYLDVCYPQSKLSVGQLNQKMKKIACEAVKATYFQLDPSNKQVGFQLFGLDFLVDCHFRPWLLEVNTNPCLELSSNSLERLIPRMLQNAFRIAIDPVFQPSVECPRSLIFYIPENMFETNRFELIFDSLYDRDFSWEEYSKSIEKVQYQDQDECFEGDGEIIDINF